MNRIVLIYVRKSRNRHENWKRSETIDINKPTNRTDTES